MFYRNPVILNELLKKYLSLEQYYKYQTPNENLFSLFSGFSIYLISAYYKYDGF